MVSIPKFRRIFSTIEAIKRETYSACINSHYGGCSKTLDENPNLAPNEKLCRVGLFWDLDNKPPNSMPPYEVVNKLRIAAASFGVVRHMVDYANSHTFSNVPKVVRERRKERQLLFRLENKGVIKPNEPYLCRVCGRKVYTNKKLVNHFKQLHKREHFKRMNRIESSRGSRKVKLVGKYSMKMEKYKKAASAVLTPKVGYGLADELKRAGFWVQTVLDSPQAADIALKNHIVDMMDHRRVECVVLISDDYDFVDVIKEAKLRCLKTVVIGDASSDGVLKRTADTAFSWEEILMGKAKKQTVSVVENWKDRDILKRLEWTYNPNVDKKKVNLDDTAAETSEDDDIEDICGDIDDDYKDDRGSWWELDPNDNDVAKMTSLVLKFCEVIVRMRPMSRDEAYDLQCFVMFTVVFDPQEQTKHSDQQLSYQCQCSFLEIYNEQITDLLDPNQRNLQIREDVKSGVYVESLTEEQVSTMKDITQLLMKGLSNRRIGATSINSESSRSHTVFTCVVESRCKSVADGVSRFKTSRINLVDLAGSERQKSTGAAGERLKEAGNINRSLSQLGNLINILAEVSQTGKQRHIPYRDSRLTFLLQESLGGNAKLAMVCAISPAQSCRSETFSTLRFAQRAKAIKNKAVVNEVMEDNVIHLRQVIRQLRDELHRIKADGYNPTDPSGGHSAAWVRKSLNILQSSLNRPPPLSRVDEDGDEEMEIDEEEFEDHDEVFCNANVNCNIVSENDNKMNTDDQDLAQPNEEKNNPSISGSKLLNEESPCALVRSSLSCPAGKSDIGDFTGFAALDASSCSLNATVTCASPGSLSIVKCDLSPILKSPTPSVSPRISTSRKSLRTSSGMSPSENDLQVASELGIKTGNLKSSSTAFSSQTSPSLLTKTENLAASIRHGLEIIDSHRSTALRKSSYRFSLRPRESRLTFPVDKVDVGMQTFLDDNVEEDSILFTCSNCKNKAQLDINEADNNSNLQLVPIVNEADNSSNLQLVPVDCSGSVDKPKKQVLKAVEKVLAGSIRREMALEEYCAKQTSEIMQLNRLVKQYKNEREYNAIIAQTREEKILRLESLMDGVLPTEEFMDEELAALTHEHKLLKEKYENHHEVLRMEIEFKRLRDELEEYQSFYKLGEREVLMEEIQSLRSQLQFYIDSSSTAARKQYPLLQLTGSSEPSLAATTLTAIPESIEERNEKNEIPASMKDSAEIKLEQERIKWTEAESRWISLAEELRADLEANRSLAEKRKQELDAERECTKELQEAMHMAIEGHARILEQYADLEENHILLLARHRRIQEGIEDVKKAASRAGVRGAESKFINALAAEISALKAEREKERRILRDENRGLKAQLKDTAEAVQAAGELLFRLKEAEESVINAQKRAMDAEQEAAKAYKQIDKLKKKHEKEIFSLNELVAEAHPQKESVPPIYDDAVMPNYDDESKDPLRVNDQFGPFNNIAEDGELAKLAEPSWFSSYDRCNI